MAKSIEVDRIFAWPRRGGVTGARYARQFPLLPVKLRRLRDLAWRAAEIGWATAMVSLPIRRGPRHALDRELVVSLTSYPPRFPTLHLTLRALLSQSVSPDRLVLWIAHSDIAKLPPKVTALVPRGLEIRGCDDLRSFKKIIPALEAFPEAYFVTADDDLYYRRYWLEALQIASKRGSRDLVAHRVNRPAFRQGKMRSIREWEMNAVGADLIVPSDGLQPCSGAGVLFPPNSLHPDVTNRELFLALSPTCDDTWLAWMANRQGTKIRRPSAASSRLIAWKGTNANSLWVANSALANHAIAQDEIVERLSEHYGPLHR